MTRWGLVATVKAPRADIERFAAYHLEQGAQRVHLYLDDPDTAIAGALNAHPKLRVTVCDTAHWRKLGGKPPVKHQVRQSRNATHAYARRPEVDWLIHMDVDEFLWPDRPMAEILAALPAETLCARARPVEQLAGNPRLFKGFIPNGPDRAAQVARLYPTYGRHLKGGFMSHVAGKLFLRTGLPGIEWRIHNAFQNGRMNPGETELASVRLCHAHARDWEDWHARFRFRLARGSYRADLPPADKSAASLHEVLSGIEAESGTAGLRAFFDEVCADTPGLRARLAGAGLLLEHDLALDAARAKHFS